MVKYKGWLYLHSVNQTQTRTIIQGLRDKIPGFSLLFLRFLLSALGFVLLLNACQQPSSGGGQPKQDQSGNQGTRPGNKTGSRNQARSVDRVLDREPIDRQAERLIYTRHARCRMGCRHITEVEIREILQNGEINYHKSEPNSRPDPKYALEGYTKEGQHLRVIFAPSDRGLVVITCIELGIEWQCDCH